MNDKLSPKERTRFEACKQQIEEGLQSCFDTGMALLEIKTSRLYREEFNTWEEFCRNAYQIGERRAHYLISAFETQEIIKKANERAKLTGTMVPLLTNERQARELSKVPENDRVKVLQSASQNGPITAKSIAAAASRPEIRMDAIGRVIPDEILSEWDRATELGSRLRSLASEIKNAVKRGLDEKDVIFAEILNPTISEASQLGYSLSQIIPHSVCPMCQGKIRKTCQLCRKRGWISKFMWNSPSVSEATKKLIERTVAKGKP